MTFQGDIKIDFLLIICDYNSLAYMLVWTPTKHWLSILYVGLQRHAPLCTEWTHLRSRYDQNDSSREIKAEKAHTSREKLGRNVPLHNRHKLTRGEVDTTCKSKLSGGALSPLRMWSGKDDKMLFLLTRYR